jgi:hypothetical protein
MTKLEMSGMKAGDDDFANVEPVPGRKNRLKLTLGLNTPRMPTELSIRPLPHFISLRQSRLYTTLSRQKAVRPERLTHGIGSAGDCKCRLPCDGQAHSRPAGHRGEAAVSGYRRDAPWTLAAAIKEETSTCLNQSSLMFSSSAAARAAS